MFVDNEISGVNVTSYSCILTVTCPIPKGASIVIEWVVKCETEGKVRGSLAVREKSLAN